MTDDELNAIWVHLFERDYMSGVERNETRIKARGEVFTPKELADELLDKMGNLDPDLFRDPKKTFLDPTCGDGELLAGALWRKLIMQKTPSFTQALSTLYGVDIEWDNVRECRKRLRCNFSSSEVRSIVNRNILKRDARTYDFSFGEKRSSADFQEQSDWVSQTKSKN